MNVNAIIKEIGNYHREEKCGITKKPVHYIEVNLENIRSRNIHFILGEPYWLVGFVGSNLWGAGLTLGSVLKISVGYFPIFMQQ